MWFQVWQLHCRECCIMHSKLSKECNLKCELKRCVENWTYLCWKLCYIMNWVPWANNNSLLNLKKKTKQTNISRGNLQMFVLTNLSSISKIVFLALIFYDLPVPGWCKIAVHGAIWCQKFRLALCSQHRSLLNVLFHSGQLSNWKGQWKLNVINVLNNNDKVKNDVVN